MLAAMTFRTRVLTLLAAFFLLGMAAAQAPPAPAMVVSLGFDNDNVSPTLTWHAAIPAQDEWRSAALKIAAQAQSGGGSTGEGTWVILAGQAFLDPNLSGSQSAAASFLATRDWLRKETGTIGDAFSATGTPLAGLAGSFHQAHRDAIASRELCVDPDRLAYLLAGSRANSGEGVREWAQPFLRDAQGVLAPQLVWRTYCDYWAASGISNWLWSSSYSRAKEPADFATGQHMFSVNRLAEAILTHQIPSPTGTESLAFLQSPDYLQAIELGLRVALHVVTVRHPGAISTANPITTPALGTDLSGLWVSERLILRPVLRSPDDGDVYYEIEPASPFALVPGQPAILAMGQSAVVDTAVFDAVGGGTVQTTLYPLNFFAGVVSLMVPANAAAGPVDFIKAAGPPAPAWATRVRQADWDGSGTVLTIGFLDAM
jgi:hypothetical protein